MPKCNGFLKKNFFWNHSHEKLCNPQDAEKTSLSVKIYQNLLKYLILCHSIFYTNTVKSNTIYQAIFRKNIIFFSCFSSIQPVIPIGVTEINFNFLNDIFFIKILRIGPTEQNQTQQGKNKSDTCANSFYHITCLQQKYVNAKM